MDSVARRQRRLRRGTWICNPDEILQTIADFFNTIRETLLTDVYIHISLQKWAEHRDALIGFNQEAHRNAIRVWIVNGHQMHVDSPDAGERFIDGLRALIEFNDTAPVEAKFYGFQAWIELEDSTVQTNSFHNDLATSQLDEVQHTQRDMLLHKWLNIYTRASAFMRSYEIPFGAAVPYWLTNYQGESIDVNWASGDGTSRCIMELIMPLVDEYVVLSGHADPAWVSSRTLDALRYASKQLVDGQEGPQVIVSIDPSFQEPTKHNSTSGLSTDRSKDVVLKDIAATEHLLQKYDAFGGIVINDFVAWRSLPRLTTGVNSISSSPPATAEQQHMLARNTSPNPALDARFDAVIQRLQNLHRID